MAIPTNGYIKIWSDTTSILSGAWAFANDAAPQPSRTAAQLETYFDARVPSLVTGACASRNSETPAASGNYGPAVNTFELGFSPSSINFDFYSTPPPGGAVVGTTSLYKADFPMGFAFVGLQVVIVFQISFGDYRLRNITNLEYMYKNSNFYDYTFPTPPSIVTGNVASPTSGASRIIPAFTTWGFTQGFANFGLRVPVTLGAAGVASDCRAIISDCFLLGEYTTLTYAFHPDGMTTGQSNVLPGEISDLVATNDNFDDFDQDEFQIFWDVQDGEEESDEFPGFAGGVLIPRNLILTFTSSRFKFIMPTGLGIPYGGRRLMLVGKGLGAFFVGKVPLQQYNITLVDGSGLYTLVEDKRNDTYYDRSTTPVTTVDLKIPTPFVKTGFFPE